MRAAPVSPVAATPLHPSAPAPATSRFRPARRSGIAVFTASGLLALWHLIAPSVLSETILGLVGIAALLAVAFGPHLRGARPTGLWMLVTIGSLLSAVAAVLDVVTPPGFGVSDVIFIVGYVCYFAWFAGVARLIGHSNGVPLLLDILAAASAIMLGLWTIPALNPGHTDLAKGAVWGLYPLLDAMELVLVGHLAYRAGWRSSGWPWLFAALAALLTKDAVLAVGAVAEIEIVTRVGTALGIFPYVALGLAASAPAVVDLTRQVAAPPTGNHFWRSAAVYVAIFPGVASLALPPGAGVDLTIRAALVGILLVLMLMRLLRTLGEVSRAEAQARHRADHDPLTGLLTRAALLDEVARRIPADQDEGAVTGILFLDCDNFKSVNDVWGHPAGDALLRAIGERLGAGVRVGDVVARHGGDEFVVVTRVADASEAEDLAARIRGLFDAPFEVLSGVHVAITPSIGVATSTPATRPTPLDLLERADVALISAKEQGRARHVLYDDRLDELTQSRARLVEALREAVARDRIDIAFQPIYGGPAFDRLLGWESLARWHHPDLGDVPPDVFIAAAEDLGLIDRLGRQVLRKSCAAAATLRTEAAFAHTHVAVNVSALQLHRSTFADAVVETLRETGLPRDALILEITESVLISSTSPAHHAVARLRDAGLRISIDDFGTGYSSITALLSLPVDCVKIDRSLVQDIDHDPVALAQLRAVIDLVTSLDIDQVIAEGIESDSQARALTEVGCPMGQGYLFGRPVPPACIAPQAMGIPVPAAGMHLPTGRPPSGGVMR